MRRKLGALALLVLLAGCVEEQDASLDGAGTAEPAPAAAAPPPPATGVVASLTEWQVALTHTQVAAGTVSVEVQNNGTEPHALAIEGGGQEWRTDPLQPGETITLSVVLQPGTYNVFCPVASGGEAHADRGMKTTLQAR